MAKAKKKTKKSKKPRMTAEQRAFAKGAALRARAIEASQKKQAARAKKEAAKQERQAKAAAKKAVAAERKAAKKAAPKPRKKKAAKKKAAPRKKKKAAKNRGGTGARLGLMSVAGYKHAGKGQRMTAAIRTPVKRCPPSKAAVMTTIARAKKSKKTGRTRIHIVAHSRCVKV